jgi:hypothetical protein
MYLLCYDNAYHSNLQAEDEAEDEDIAGGGAALDGNNIGEQEEEPEYGGDEGGFNGQHDYGRPGPSHTRNNNAMMIDG